MAGVLCASECVRPVKSIKTTHRMTNSACYMKRIQPCEKWSQWRPHFSSGRKGDSGARPWTTIGSCLLDARGGGVLARIPRCRPRIYEAIAPVSIELRLLRDPRSVSRCEHRDRKTTTLSARLDLQRQTYFGVRRRAPGPRNAPARITYGELGGKPPRCITLRARRITSASLQ